MIVRHEHSSQESCMHSPEIVFTQVILKHHFKDLQSEQGIFDLNYALIVSDKKGDYETFLVANKKQQSLFKLSNLLFNTIDKYIDYGLTNINEQESQVFYITYFYIQIKQRKVFEITSKTWP